MNTRLVCSDKRKKKSHTKPNQNQTKSITYFRKKCYKCWAPTKAQFILHELISQILLFWNYENYLHAY